MCDAGTSRGPANLIAHECAPRRGQSGRALGARIPAQDASRCVGGAAGPRARRHVADPQRHGAHALLLAAGERRSPERLAMRPGARAERVCRSTGSVRGAAELLVSAARALSVQPQLECSHHRCLQAASAKATHADLGMARTDVPQRRQQASQLQRRARCCPRPGPPSAGCQWDMVIKRS